MPEEKKQLKLLKNDMSCTIIQLSDRFKSVEFFFNSQFGANIDNELYFLFRKQSKLSKRHTLISTLKRNNQKIKTDVQK